MGKELYPAGSVLSKAYFCASNAKVFLESIPYVKFVSLLDKEEEKKLFYMIITFCKKNTC